jgi:hypothetical protein
MAKRRTVPLSWEQRQALETGRDHERRPSVRERCAALHPMADGHRAHAVARAGLLRARDPDPVSPWRAHTPQHRAGLNGSDRPLGGGGIVGVGCAQHARQQAGEQRLRQPPGAEARQAVGLAHDRPRRRPVGRCAPCTPRCLARCLGRRLVSPRSVCAGGGACGDAWRLGLRPAADHLDSPHRASLSKGAHVERGWHAPARASRRRAWCSSGMRWATPAGRPPPGRGCWPPRRHRVRGPNPAPPPTTCQPRGAQCARAARSTSSAPSWWAASRSAPSTASASRSMPPPAGLCRCGEVVESSPC